MAVCVLGVAAANWEEFLFSGDTLDRRDDSGSRRAGQCPLANIKGQFPPELVRRVDELAVAFVADLVSDGPAGREEVAVVARRGSPCCLGTPEPFVATDALLGNSSADGVLVGWSWEREGAGGPSARGERQKQRDHEKKKTLANFERRAKGRHERVSFEFLVRGNEPDSPSIIQFQTPPVVLFSPERAVLKQKKPRNKEIKKNSR
jgi:hypothetical protein